MGSTKAPSIFKAYDIRGLVGSELTPDFTFATGAAFARFIMQEREPGTIVIGQDMRPSSPQLADAFSAGVTSLGLDVSLDSWQLKTLFNQVLQLQSQMWVKRVSAICSPSTLNIFILLSMYQG